MAALEWKHLVSEVGERGLDIERQADAAERDAVARELGILACNKIEVRYRLTPRSKGRFYLRGRLDADIEQACVVSLEPVPEAIAADIDLEFWPVEQFEQAAEIEVDDVDHDDPEPIANGALEIGRVVYELLASQADPYPRLPGEELEQSESGQAGDPDEPDAGNPFAKLAALKKHP